MPMSPPSPLTDEVRAILNTYEGLRPGMPTASFPAKPTRAASLRELLPQFDALFLDGFGVLNIGDTLIPGAEALIAETHARNIPILVVTNAASQSVASIGRRYLTKGLDISPPQVVASREALTQWLGNHRPGDWQSIAIADSNSGNTAAPLDLADLTQHRLTPATTLPADCAAIALLGTRHWDATWHTALASALTDQHTHRPRELLIANPDIAAPHPSGFSHEPGAVAHTLRQSHPDIPIRWFGKPHQPHFDLAFARLAKNTGTAIPDRSRIAMVGDSLHTDILGGAAAGLTTVLVTDHGLFQSGGAEEAIAMTGIVPQYITPTI